MMKIFFSFIIFVLVLNGCDDGNLTLENINFDQAKMESCSTNNILFKLKQNEALLLEIPKTVFVNEPTSQNPLKPIILDINNVTNRLVYQFFNGTVTTENICNTIRPATPIVTKAWTAISGKIEIITTTIAVPGKIAGSTVLTGYNHLITFKNLTFDKGNGTQVYETFVFGNYITNSTLLNLQFDLANVVRCPKTKQLYKFNATNETLTLEDLDETLIVNVETPLNTPRTALIGTSKNKLSYRIFDGLLSSNYFCNVVTPALPKISEEWKGIDGVANSSGVIEVTTIRSGTTAFRHTIVIKNASLKKGNSSFKLGDVFNYGELTTF